MKGVLVINKHSVHLTINCGIIINKLPPGLLEVPHFERIGWQ